MAEMDPGLSLIKGPASNLKHFKVLGTVDRVLLVMDKTSDETYILKVNILSKIEYFLLYIKPNKTNN